MAFEPSLRRIAGLIGALVCALGLVSAIGLLFHMDVLRVLRPTPNPLKFNAALCLALTGASLWWQRRGEANRAGTICAALALAISTATALEGLTGWNLGLDQVFVRDLFGSRTGRMVPLTALAFAVMSIALLAMRQPSEKRRPPASTWLASLVVAWAVAGLLGTSMRELPDVHRPLSFGLHVGLSLVALGLGVLCSRPEDKPLRTLFNSGPTGVFARRLLFGVALVPLLLAMTFVALLRFGGLHMADGVFLLTIALVLAGFIVTLLSIDTAAEIQESREEAEQARLLLTARLQDQAAQLQETVSVRTRELREANANLRAIAESNALLAMVAQHATNGVIITDADGRIEWVNAAFTRVTGYELNEVKARKPGHVLQGPETDPATSAKLRDAQQHGQPCLVEILNYTKQGAIFWHIVDMQPVRDRSGHVVNFVANLTDVTGQRADKQRLQQFNQRLELATRTAALGVWEWDAATHRSVWDDRMLEIYGFNRGEFQGTSEEWKARLHPHDRPGAVARGQLALRDGDRYELEFRIVRAHDRAERHIESRAVIQRDAQGRVVSVIGTERDVTAEREAKQRTETLNERLRLALRSSNYGVWEYDILTGRRVWDERVLEIYGLRAEDFDGRPDTWIHAIHPEDRDAATEYVRRVLIGEVADYNTEFRIVRPDGTVRHVESHGYLQRDARGRPVRLVGLNRDVTEQRRMAEALESAEQRLQLAIEAANDAVWDWNVASGVVYHDERWEKMLGYAPGELVQHIDTWKSLVHPDDLADNETAIRQHFEQATAFYQHELRMRAKDGTWRWILDRGKVVTRADDGRPLRMAGTHTDITERKQLEQRLHKSEELTNEVSRLAQIGGWEIDLETSRVTWTQATRRIHGVDDAFQPTLENVWQFFPPESLEVVQPAMRSVTPAAPSFDIVVPLITANNGRRWVRLLGHGEFRGGKAVNVHGAIQDITAQHESEDARRQLESQLFQAQKMETLGTLAGGIAHDFNNLLTGIIGYHELAADSLPEDHPSRMCLNEARNASLRARELVEQILTFGRQSTSTEHGPVDLPMVIEEARRFLRATLPANITIEVNCAPDSAPVLADATQIYQVILNLGSNAAHAMRHHGGQLRIALEPTALTPDLAMTLGAPAANSYTRLSVSDTGHGMDESTRRRIFDPFFTTKNTREGTGLGLAVVHGIVRSHRGAIDVESMPGVGATFHIYLPTASAQNFAADSTGVPAPRGEGEYVVVVDDEEVVGSCTKLVLESKGYRSLIFGSAEQCLAEIQPNPARCAVLVTDQTMPGMQGTELAAALRKLNPTLPLVIMSGYFSKISPQALDELGPVELLAKPFTTDELAHAVHRALHPAAVEAK